MNYGHPLEFGTFVTPVDGAVGLARRSEELGFDLVTFQDHPYQPAFLDTWTLLSWVAGRTSTIRLAPNVLNLPLRDPAVLARSAASLDLLSGGRLQLAVGAGGFWDAIHAMGGRRLTPGGAVTATGEAIDVIRGILDAGEATPLRIGGERYHVDGAARGPLPAHHIPLWVGARKRRMLRLIGEKADGWLVSLPFVAPPQLRAGNKIVDEAAESAGREPGDIRRLLNIAGTFADRRGGFLQGPPEQWVEELLPLIVEDGFGTLILMTDEPSTMERFAAEVAPALRAAVDRELPEPLPTSAARDSTVRRQRRTGIEYDAVPRSLAELAVEPGDIDYARVRNNYLRGGSPGLVLRPSTTEQVVEALGFARRHPHLPLGVRSGGHGVSGRSTNDGGIVIDLGRLNEITVLDEATRRVRVGPGARWKQVALALEPYGWALTSGDYGGVGVGGLATAGGIGFLGREQGLTIDHLRAAEVVLADGAVVRASDDENPDLFWAIRGAGGNFGIVTSFEFEVDPVAEAVGWAQLAFDATDTAGFLEAFGKVAAGAPRDTTAFLLMGPRRRGQPAIAQVMALIDAAEPETIVERLQPFAGIATLYSPQIVVMPYASVMNMFPDSEHHGQGEPISRTGFVSDITPAFARDVERLLASGVVYFFQIRTTGGATSDVDPDATAYAHRGANFSVTAMGMDPVRTDALWDGLRQHFDGLYLSFETDPRPERLGDAFPPRTLDRLRKLKARFDPDNVFRDNFNIPPRTSIHKGPVMTDYGHDLLFGTFITPVAQPATRAVELAVTADRAGLDLVTFQDHPYQPSFHDTWTLLSYVASRTSRVRLAPNVLNLPLRQPAVVARAAASLDLLSGGRFELGIGTGAFWDAIVAMGGPRRSPGEAIEALEEAITILREVWAVDRPGPVKVDGQHYRVHGAKRGPAPAHDIGVWIGSYKPRLLRLTGRLGDGWLPSLAYLEEGPAALARMNEHIDEGAAAAGRQPAQIRRLLNVSGQLGRTSRGLLNGPADQWTEELAGLTLEYGISGFILAGDDPGAVELFANEVAPATRELVATERAR